MTVLARDKSARDIVWWQLSKQGKSSRQIAKEFRVSHSTVSRGISRERARRELPKFRLLIPQVLVPQSPCPHERPIEAGDNSVCLICHASGWDGHPELVPTEPVEPEGEKAYQPPEDGLLGGLGSKPRKQKRKTAGAIAL